MYTVYVLYSQSFDKIYIGFTSDLEQRLISHNHPKNKGWTARFKPWVVIYTESCNEKSAAMRREAELKSFRGREFIRNLINDSA